MIRHFLLIFLFFTPFFAFSQRLGSTDTKKLSEANKAYFFLKGQELTLEHLSKNMKYDNELENVIYNTNQYFSKTKESLREYLSTSIGESRFTKSEDSLTQVIFEKMDFGSINREDAIREINRRLNKLEGIPENIRTTLIHFKYANNFSAIIGDGFYDIFSSKGHPKAKGADFNLKYPTIFNEIDGARPNIIKTFNYELDDNGFNFNIGVRENEVGKVLKQDVLDLISSGQVKQMISEDAEFIKAEHVFIENCNGVKIEFKQKMQRLDLKFEIRMWSYMIFDGNHLYTFIFGYNVPSNGQDLSKKYQPLITSIVNTFVINTNY